MWPWHTHICSIATIASTNGKPTASPQQKPTTSCMQQSASLTASRTTCCTTDPQHIEANGVRHYRTGSLKMRTRRSRFSLRHDQAQTPRSSICCGRVARRALYSKSTTSRTTQLERPVPQQITRVILTPGDAVQLGVRLVARQVHNSGSQKKNIPNIFDYNLKTDHQILIICCYEYSRHNWPSSNRSISHFTRRQFLHYQGKQNQRNITFFIHGIIIA